MEHEYDIAIIGGGPVGMFATFYAGLRSADVLLLESTPQLGGQPAALYPQKQIYDAAGFFAVRADELTSKLDQQMARFKPDVQLNTKVTAITTDATGVTLTTDAKNYRAKSVIVATGAGAFEPRPLAAPHDKTLVNDKIFYIAPDLNTFARQDVVIAGGGDSAIDWALALEPIAKSVRLIHRRNQFRGLESSVTALENSTVELLTPYLIKEVSETATGLSLSLRPVRDAEPQTITADKLLVSYGFASDNRQLRNWGLQLEHGQIKVDASYATNLDHVYAIGDAVTYPGKQKLIASGFGEAPTAVSSIMSAIHPELRQNLHSSELKL
jgi:thioredoxin reductase (NADPH)